jgi:geranylgeranyl transferase type-1 subunit beta
MLNSLDYIDQDSLESFLKLTASESGGFGKTPNSYPDVMHSYMALVGLSMAGKNELEDFFAPLGLSSRAVSFAQSKGLCLG